VTRIRPRTYAAAILPEKNAVVVGAAPAWSGLAFGVVYLVASGTKCGSSPARRQHRDCSRIVTWAAGGPAEANSAASTFQVVSIRGRQVEVCRPAAAAHVLNPDQLRQDPGAFCLNRQLDAVISTPSCADRAFGAARWC